MLMVVMAAAAALLVQTVPAGEPVGQPTSAQFENARRLLDERLLDFPSARFRDVRADQGRICGFVNAKNAMGAYTGWKPFGVMGSSGGLIWIDDPFMLEPLCTPALRETPADYSERLAKG